MTKPHKILIIILIVIVAVAAVFAAQTYANRPKVKPGLSVAVVSKQRDQAVAALQTQKVTDNKVITNLTTVNTQLSAQKATVCAQLARYRLTNINCQ